MRSFEMALVVFFIGAIFMIASFATGVLNVEVCWGGAGDAAYYQLVSCAKDPQLRKQVGFGLALNWSFGLCVLLPFFVYCASETVRSASTAIAEMSQRKMFVRDDWSTPKAGFIEALVRKRQWIIVITIAGLIALLATGFVLVDYQRVVGQFYSDSSQLAGKRLGDPEFEADWSIAAPICEYTADPSQACQQAMSNRALNGVLAGAAYLYLPFLGAVAAITFMVSFALFVRFVFSADLRAAGIRVVPDINSKDPRRGFEVLAEFFMYSVLACFNLFAMGYLVTLQNVYLRTQSANIFDFVLPLIPTEVSIEPAKWLEGIKGSVALVVVNGNSLAVTILGVLFLGLMILSAAYVLGREARAGRDRLLAALTAPGAPTAQFKALLGSTTPTAAKKALKEAEFWPLRWPSVNVMLVWLALATVSLLFVVVGFYIVTLGLSYVLSQALAKKTDKQ